VTRPTRDTWFGEARALAASARLDADTWQRDLLPLADQAALLARDPDELREVFLPTLAALAERWEDADRINRRHEPLIDPHRALYRALSITTPAHAASLLALHLPHMPALRHLAIDACDQETLRAIARLPDTRSLDSLHLARRAGEALDVNELPWLRRLTLTIHEPIDALLADALTHLTLHMGGRAWGEGFTAVLHTPNLHTLTLQDCPLDEDALGALLAASAFKDLRSLTLTRCAIDVTAALRLASSPQPALRELTIHGDLTSHGARHLSRAPWIAQLDRLDLRHNTQLGPDGLHALRAALAPTCQLDMRGCWGDAPPEAPLIIRARAPHALVELLHAARERRAAHITLLDATSEVLTELLAHDLPELRALHMPHNTLDGEDLRALALAPLASRLTSLDLSGAHEHRQRALQNHDWRDGLHALLGAATQLEHLDLSDMRYGLDRITKLPAPLRSLRLARNDLHAHTLKDLYHLLNKVYALATLDVSENPRLGPDALLKLSRLRGICITATGCWGAAAVHVADMRLREPEPEELDELLDLAPRLPLLRGLQLDGPDITTEQLAALRPPNLTALTIRDCLLGPDDLRALPPGLTALTLALEELDPEHAAALADLDLTRLTTLDLSGSGITTAALTTLLAAIPNPLTLVLNGCARLDSSCATPLLERCRAGLLDRLDLRHNNIGVEAAQRLLAELPHAQLHGCWGDALLEAQRAQGPCKIQHIDHDGLMELVAWPGLYDVTGLDLSWTPFTAEHATHLSSNPWASCMDALDVTGCPLSLIGWNALQGWLDVEAAATPSEAARSDTLRLTDYVLDNALWIEALLTQDLSDVHSLDLEGVNRAPLDVVLRVLESPRLQNLRTFLPSLYFTPSEDAADPIERRVAQALARLQSAYDED
jgi:hypothetical protein